MKVKRILAVLLSVVILLSASTTGAFAQEQNNFVVQAEQINNEKSVLVSWEAVSNAGSYTVYRTPYTAYGDIDMQSLDMLAKVDKNTYSYVDNNVDWYDSYYYFVSAKIGDDELISAKDASAFVVNPNPVFESEAHVEEVINKIFTAKEIEIVDRIKKQRQQDVEDKYVTLRENCGPASIALQKVLADLDIYCEVRRAVYNYNEGMGMSHEYCLLRVNYGDDFDKVHNLIVDPTNRQYLRDAFSRNLKKNFGYTPSDADIDYALLNSCLPSVLVFDYSDINSGNEKVKAYLNKGEYGESFYDDYFCMYAYENNRYSYPEQILMMCYDRGVTAKQFKAIKEAGKLNKPYEQELYINSRWNGEKTPLEYKSNGIYQCCISVDKLPEYNFDDKNTVTITDINDNIIYGANEESELYTSSAVSYNYMAKNFIYLNDEIKNPLKWNIYRDSNTDVVVQIDMRTGVDKPLITAYPAKAYKYGDINLDGDINILDATLLQMYVSKQENLETKQITAADIFDNGEINIKNATEIQSYVAEYQTESDIDNAFYAFLNFYFSMHLK